MKWIKAAERLPEGTKKAVNIQTGQVGELIINSEGATFNKQFEDGGYVYDFKDNNLYSNIIWLDESQASDKDKEIERLKGLINSKDSILLDVERIFNLPKCYKTKGICRYDCKGLCKDSC